MNNDLTQTQVKELLHYNPETGVFTWLRPLARCVSAGEIAGYTNAHGYRRVTIARKQHFAHRLAFLYMTGEWPEDQVDHINGVKSDNRWCNLRQATRSQNQYNKSKLVTNTSGYKEVYWDTRTNKLAAFINVTGKQINLGNFSSKEKAARAYDRAAIEFHGEFAATNENAGLLPPEGEG